MTYGNRGIKAEARIVQKEAGVLYTEALALAKANREDVVEEVFGEILHEASVKIVDYTASRIAVDKVELFEVAFVSLFDTLSKSGKSKAYANARLEKAVSQAVVLDSEDGTPVTDAVSHIRETIGVAVSLLEAVPV